MVKSFEGGENFGENFKVKKVDHQILVDYLKKSVSVLGRIGREGENFLHNIFNDENHYTNSRGNTQFVIAFDDRGFWVLLEMTPSANLLTVGAKGIEMGLPLKPGFVNDWLNNNFRV